MFCFGRKEHLCILFVRKNQQKIQPSFSPTSSFLVFSPLGIPSCRNCTIERGRHSTIKYYHRRFSTARFPCEVSAKSRFHTQLNCQSVSAGASQQTAHHSILFQRLHTSLHCYPKGNSHKLSRLLRQETCPFRLLE